jgi:phytanoyl-CoA dioxygenase PhyH
MSSADQTPAASPVDVVYFRAFGFILLPRFFDPRPLAEEVDRVLRNGSVRSWKVSDDEIRFQYVPMMTSETPHSLSLLDRVESVASTLLGGPVLPIRAKGTRCYGNSPWHIDSTSVIASVGFLAYLEQLGPETGALRVLPGSHRPDFSQEIRANGAIGLPATALPSHVIVTEPGDLIVLDEHLFHSSFGGATRRQWRVDYVCDPVGAEAERQTKAYFQNIYQPDWDGGYDVDRYPSYGLDWHTSGRGCVGRLGELGVYDFAAKHEAFARGRRKVE